MRPDTKTISAFCILSLATILTGAKMGDSCGSTAPTPYCSEDCTFSYKSLGPENIMVNAPVRPLICEGDFDFTLAAFYWTATQDGMEYAIDNDTPGSDAVTMNPQLNNLFEAEFKGPGTHWNLGFKVGVAYNTPCDGWDFSILWTSFKNSTTTHDEAQGEDNHTLIPLWSAFQFPNAGQAPILFASDIQTWWKLDMNLIDLDLGREFWTSKYLSLRPHIGLRLAYLDQKFEIQHRGGSWINTGLPDTYNDRVHLDNDFRGVGLRSGFDTNWNLGCGWSLYADLAAAIVYGRFSLDHDESLRQAEFPFSKNRIFEANESFKASRGILDLGLGVRWAGLICGCRYGLSFTLGWEEHLFLHQNQLWRVQRVGGTNGSGIFNGSGENVYNQSRGTLGTRGVTLTGVFTY